MSKQRCSRNVREYDENTLFVTVEGSKLPGYITGQLLKEHFRQFEDDIVNSMVCREKDTMKSKGYGFITFTSSAVAHEAMLTLQGSLLRGKFPLTVKYQRKSSDSFTAVTTSDLSGGTGSCADNSTDTTLYVGVYDSKLPNYVNSGHLQQHFSEFQHWIKGAMIVRDSETKETKGYGFVTFTSNAAAELAMKKLQGSNLHDKFRLYINFKETTCSESPVSSILHSRVSSVFDLSSCTYSDDEDEIGSECTLYVGVHNSKFPNYINSRHLEAHFSEFEAHIKKAMIIRDMITKESKGFGLVTFSCQSVAENAMKKLHGSKLNGKFSLFISLKGSNFIKAKPISKPSILETEKSLVQLNGTTEQLLYLRYCFYNFPTDESSTLKLSLPAELMLRNSILYLFGTESARKTSSSLIHTSKLVQNLQSRDFSGAWDQHFVSQLQDSILTPINTSKQDILCILTERQEEGPNKISFRVQIFSHSVMTLLETQQKLIVSRQ